MKIISILIALCFVSINTDDIANSKNCESELTVEKNRNTRSADETGTSFRLVLKNTSSTTQTYYLSANNAATACTNNSKYNQRSAGSKNVSLNVSLETKNSDHSQRSKLNEITLNSGQSYSFDVYVSVPKNTPYNTWSCIQVEAKSKSCGTLSSKTTLNVYVPDPSEG